MHEHILERMRDCIRSQLYIMTLHAEEEMADDHLTIFDIEHVILTGIMIERQKDAVSAEWKFVIEGNTVSAGRATVIAKFGFTGKLVIITVFIGRSYDM